MKAILLAAGLGTRLKPITNSTPKCLVPIKGQPLLGYWLNTLVNLGINEILINTHYFSEQVELFINSHQHKDKVTLVYEEELLGTAGTLLRNKSFWQSDDVLVAHADNFCMSDLIGLKQTFIENKAHFDATMLLFKSNTPKSCGVVELNEKSTITAFHEKVDNPPTNLASGAVFIFSDNVYDKYFSSLNENQFLELSIDVIPNMVNKIQGWLVDGFFIDIGTPDTYKLANNL